MVQIVGRVGSREDSLDVEARIEVCGPAREEGFLWCGAVEGEWVAMADGLMDEPRQRQDPNDAQEGRRRPERGPLAVEPGVQQEREPRRGGKRERPGPSQRAESEQKSRGGRRSRD
jgi:hypothetical protein